MNKVFLSFLTALLIVSCGKQPSAPAEVTGEAAEVEEAVLAKAAGDQASPVDVRSAYTFVVDFDFDDNGQCGGLMLDCNFGEKTQDFGFEFNWPKDKEILVDEGSGEISEDDINGDGWPDIVICLGNFGVVSPLYFYGACVWNPDDESFYRVWEYDGIPNAEPCQLDGKPAIKSVSEGLDGSATIDYYLWEGRKLVHK